MGKLMGLMLVVVCCTTSWAAAEADVVTKPSIASEIQSGTATDAVLNFFRSLDRKEYERAFSQLDPNTLVVMNRFMSLMSMDSGAIRGNATAIGRSNGPEFLRTLFSELPQTLSLVPDEVVGEIVKMDHAWVIVGYDIPRLVNQMSPEMRKDPMSSVSLELFFAEKLYWTWEAQLTDGEWRIDLGIWSNVISLFSMLSTRTGPSVLDDVIPTDKIIEEKGKDRLNE